MTRTHLATLFAIFPLIVTVHFDSSRHMDLARATEALGALAQESRLKVFRLLVRTGPSGMAAGDIARKLTVPHNTMSSHLAVLARVPRLISSRKEGRSVIYAVNLEGTRELLAFLIEDCCRGKPHLCAPLIESTLVECCQP
jgi:DNA-binding transcriptional ArsR family regulator